MQLATRVYFTFDCSAFLTVLSVNQQQLDAYGSLAGEAAIGSAHHHHDGADAAAALSLVHQRQ